jgi:hypothetical protein
MNKAIILVIMGWHLTTAAQSYAPPAGQPGSTAIHMESSLITSWATGVTVERGYVFIEDTTFIANGSNRASFGDPLNALGPATGNSADVVSLGDSGVAVLTFDAPIMNGPGFDFAVFENSFSDDYLEFAFVEVSSDGNKFVRFPNHSEVQTQIQVHGFGLTDTRRIHNLAGKYRGGYGTPFDLEDLKDAAGIDLNAITHVKIIDVIGSIGPNATYDSYGNKINEPFSSPYESGGFDLDGVGVIHTYLSVRSSIASKVDFFPNPARNTITISNQDNSPVEIIIYSSLGKLVYEDQGVTNNQQIQLDLKSGMYTIQLWMGNTVVHKTLFIYN